MAQNERSARFLNPASMSAPTGYSYAVEIGPGRTIYTSGQVALDGSGKLVGAGDLRGQTVQVFENLKTVLAEAGAGIEHIIKCTYYLTDASQVAIVREVRNQYFKTQAPASTVLEVRQLVHPDWLIEIEAVAYLPAE